MCSISARPLRIVNKICSNKPLSSLSGGMPGQPKTEYIHANCSSKALRLSSTFFLIGRKEWSWDQPLKAEGIKEFRLLVIEFCRTPPPQDDLPPKN
jgi:hypothetical protein